MDNLLSKRISAIYDLGSPGVPGDPGHPGAPARSVWTTAQSCGWRGQGGGWYWLETTPGVYERAYVPGPRYSYSSYTWVCENTVQLVYEPAIPARAPTPAIPPTPAQTILNFNLGWSAGARSIRSIAGGGYMSFKAGALIGGVIGFASSDTDGSYRNIQHAWYIANNGVRIYELGVDKMYVGSRVPGATYKIQRRGGVVTYYINDVLTYTSATPSLGVVFIDTSFYSGGDSVFDPVLAEFSEGHTTLPALRTMGSDYEFADSRAMLPALTVSSRSAVRVVSSVPALTAIGYDRPFGDARARLPALTTYAEAGLPAPPYAIADTVIGLLAVAASGLTGEIGGATVSLPRVDTMASDHAYGEVIVTLPALSTEGYSYEGNYAASLGGIVLAGGVMTPAVEVFVIMNSAGSVTSVMAVSVVHDASVASTALAADDYDLSEIASAIMRSTATANDAGPIWAQPSEVWVVNYATNASSTYESYGFNSFGKVGAAYFGAMSDGIYLLEGEDDEGMPIRASADLGRSKLGTMKQKRITECYMGVSSDDTMYLRLTVDGTPYTYAARKSADDMQVQRVDVGKGLKANYFNFEVYNHDGCDFELDRIEFRVAELSRRI